MVSKQVRHKPTCTSTEKSYKLEIPDSVTAKLICVFVFAYTDCWFSQEAAHMFVVKPCIDMLPVLRNPNLVCIEFHVYVYRAGPLVLWLLSMQSPSIQKEDQTFYKSFTAVQADIPNKQSNFRNCKYLTIHLTLKLFPTISLSLSGLKPTTILYC